MPEQIITVTKGDRTYAMFFCGTIDTDSVRFLTKQTDPFQLGVMERPAGYEVKAHQHPPLEQVIHETSEFLFLERGKIHVTVFDEEWNVLRVQELKQGEFLLFFRGGHAIKMLEDCRLIEVKQGPYPGEAKAKVFRM